MKTTVKLPSVNDLGALSKCQRQRIQFAITKQIAPHEQEHVRRFNQYNGPVEAPINLNGCRSQYDTFSDDLHKGIAADRESAMQADSDSIDPFHVDVDLDCK